jgi:iron(III) transport system ATP-binding protein
LAELLVEAVAKSHGSRHVLEDVDLRVPTGTRTAILGASGSGKTTLLRLIMGFLEVDRGRILVDGVAVADAGRTHVAPEKRAVGYVAQEGALYPHLSVADNVGFGLPRRERKTRGRIEGLLELVGLPADFASRSPHELSGGEQRRVALARALAPRPRLVLLDEPFSGLDPNLRSDTRQAVLDALEGEGATAVLVTHDQSEALSVGHQVAVLRGGRLAQTADPRVLYASPADVDLAGFVGDAVVLDGQAEAAVVVCALGKLPLVERAGRGRVVVVVRPEQIELHQTGPRREACTPGVSGVVTRTVFFGARSLLGVTIDGEPPVSVTASVVSHRAPSVGARVEVTVSGSVLAYPVPPA